MSARLNDKTADDSKRKRKWQTWPSRNHFWCGGRLITGPDRRSFIFAILFILIPSVLMCGLTWPGIFISLPLYVSIPLAAIFILLLICDYTFMFITAYRDPGIFPRQASPHPPDDNPFNYGKNKPPDEIQVVVNGTTIHVKWCRTCNIYRPPRCIHCGVCNNCVDKFDHHCPWVGNCIGRRNYRSFLFFVWSVITSAAYSLLIALLHIIAVTVEAVDEEDDDLDRFLYVLMRTFYSMLLIPYSLLAIGFVGFLGTFHCYLVITGQTTNERIKGLWKKRPNPYSLGYVLNWINSFCGPWYPSFHKLRDVHQELVRYKAYDSPEAKKERKKRKKKEKKAKKKEEKALLLVQKEKEQNGKNEREEEGFVAEEDLIGKEMNGKIHVDAWDIEPSGEKLRTHKAEKQALNSDGDDDIELGEVKH